MPFGMSPGSELSRREKLDQILEGITDVHRNFDDLLITLSASMQEHDRNNAPINVNPVGFLIKFPRVGNERSIKSVKKAPTPGEKSKQTIL